MLARVSARLVSWGQTTRPLPVKAPPSPSLDRHPNITCDPDSEDISNRKLSWVLLRGAPSGRACAPAQRLLRDNLGALE